MCGGRREVTGKAAGASTSSSSVGWRFNAVERPSEVRRNPASLEKISSS